MGLQLIRLSAYVAFRVTTHVAQVEFQPSPCLHVTLDRMVESKLGVECDSAGRRFARFSGHFLLPCAGFPDHLL